MIKLLRAAVVVAALASTCASAVLVSVQEGRLLGTEADGVALDTVERRAAGPGTGGLEAPDALAALTLSPAQRAALPYLLRLDCGGPAGDVALETVRDAEYVRDLGASRTYKRPDAKGGQDVFSLVRYAPDGDLVYDFDLPMGGVYNLTVFFEEVSPPLRKVGRRVFSVATVPAGETVAGDVDDWSAVDVYATVGEERVLRMSTSVTVDDADRGLSLVLGRVTENPEVSLIEIRSAVAAPLVPMAAAVTPVPQAAAPRAATAPSLKDEVRLDCGGSGNAASGVLTDAPFVRDLAASQTYKHPLVVAAPSTSLRYASTGDLVYTFPLPAAGTYRITFWAAELAFSTVGRRIFSVATLPAANFTGGDLTDWSAVDVFSTVGRGKAIRLTGLVRVGEERKLSLLLGRVVNNPMASYIEVRSTEVGAQEGAEPVYLLKVDCGGGGDPADGVVRDTAYVRAASATRIYPALPTVYNPLGTLRFSVRGDLAYDFAVAAAGTYRLTLQFAELYFSAPGQRVFSVSTIPAGRQAPVVGAAGPISWEAVDVYAAVGKDAILSLSTTVEVAEGESLAVVLGRVVNAPMLSRLDVRPVGSGGGNAAGAGGGVSSPAAATTAAPETTPESAQASLTPTPETTLPPPPTETPEAPTSTPAASPTATPEPTQPPQLTSAATAEPALQTPSLPLAPAATAGPVQLTPQSTPAATAGADPEQPTPPPPPLTAELTPPPPPTATPEPVQAPPPQPPAATPESPQPTPQPALAATAEPVQQTPPPPPPAVAATAEPVDPTPAATAEPTPATDSVQPASQPSPATIPEPPTPMPQPPPAAIAEPVQQTPPPLPPMADPTPPPPPPTAAATPAPAPAVQSRSGSWPRNPAAAAPPLAVPTPASAPTPAVAPTLAVAPAPAAAFAPAPVSLPSPGSASAAAGAPVALVVDCGGPTDTAYSWPSTVVTPDGPQSQDDPRVIRRSGTPLAPSREGGAAVVTAGSDRPATSGGRAGGVAVDPLLTQRQSGSVAFPLVYTLPVPAATFYDIQLLFREVARGAGPGRRMNVSVGSDVASMAPLAAGLDVFALVGTEALTLSASRVYAARWVTVVVVAAAADVTAPPFLSEIRLASASGEPPAGGQGGPARWAAPAWTQLAPAAAAPAVAMTTVFSCGQNDSAYLLPTGAPSVAVAPEAGAAGGNGGEQEALWATARVGADLAFALPVPIPGRHAVVVGLEELTHTAPGLRIFSVSLLVDGEREVVLAKDVDLVGDLGGRASQLELDALVTAAHTITLRLVASRDLATVSWVSVSSFAG